MIKGIVEYRKPICPSGHRVLFLFFGSFLFLFTEKPTLLGRKEMNIKGIMNR